jgi:hypothetical protein
MSEFDTKFSGTKDYYPGGGTRDKSEGKGRYDLITPHMIRRLALVYERGAKNHGDRNWQKGIPFSRLYSSALRHTFQALEGKTDEDHIGQAIWNLAAVIHFQELGRTDLDDVQLLDARPEDSSSNEYHVSATGGGTSPSTGFVDGDFRPPTHLPRIPDNEEGD